MRITNILCALFLLIICSAAITAQEKWKPLTTPVGKSYVALLVESDPPGLLKKQPLQLTTTESAESNSINRIVMNSDGAFYFGYQLQIEPLEGNKQFRVTIRPIPKEEEELALSGSLEFLSKRDRDYVAPSIYPNPQVIDDGDTIAIEVLAHRTTGVKVIDTIKVSANELSLHEKAARGLEAKDFSIDQVQLKVTASSLLVNGQPATQGKFGCSGSLIWFYVPGSGRFIFSIAPHEGYDFKKIGLIEHNRITFSYNGNFYEWISQGPILGQGGNWHLWVLHDTSYKEENFCTGANNNIKQMFQPID